VAEVMRAINIILAEVMKAINIIVAAIIW
jgi:hypothetical protein